MLRLNQQTFNSRSLADLRNQYRNSEPHAVLEFLTVENLPRSTICAMNGLSVLTNRLAHLAVLLAMLLIVNQILAESPGYCQEFPSASLSQRPSSELFRLPPIHPAEINANSDLPGANTDIALAGAFVESEDEELVFEEPLLTPLSSWLEEVRVGYDNGFVIAGQADLDLQSDPAPFSLKLNGWGQLRHTYLDTRPPNEDLNQFQLKRARILFSGNAFTPEFAYRLQIDGRSNSGDDLRLLDYYLTFDFGRRLWDLNPNALVFKTGRYKMPFSMARYLSGQEFQFSDRSVASMFFDVNRSLAWGLYGETFAWSAPLEWEASIFNGLVTGGAQTGSSGDLDDNFAYSARAMLYPIGEWGSSGLADISFHESPAVRLGGGFAHSRIDRSGETEFGAIRVADSGDMLANLLPASVSAYTVSLFCVDASLKFRGLSATIEYYFRNTGDFSGAAVQELFDHGFWLQGGYFICREKIEVIARWSRVVGDSGTLGQQFQSADEVAGGLVWYIKGQHAKATLDITRLNGAPIDSSSLDISPGDNGWLIRSQIQFSF